MRKNFLLRTIRIALLLLALGLLAEQAAYAQCPMCKIAAESNLKNGGSAGKGLNAGILYMLAMPYLIVAAVGFWWWRNRRPDPNMNIPEELLDENDPVRKN